MSGIKETIDAVSPHVGQISTIAGTLMSYQQNRQFGKDERTAAEFKAAQLEQNAGQQNAAAQRMAMEKRRQARYAQSRALAVAAASGGGSDPGVIDIISDLAQEGEYRALADIYQGEEAARQLRMGAAGERFKGQVSENYFKSAAAGSFMRGGMSLFTKYATGKTPVASTRGSLYDAGITGYSDLA